MACASGKSADDPPPEATEVTTVHETVLVRDGDSAQPCYSADGKRLLYVSANRAAHAQAQVYERDLKTGADRRITYQNGAVSRPRYHPTLPSILYASSTDELKENPPLLNPTANSKPSKLPPRYTNPLEIYMHSLGRLNIERLTRRPGFDGEARFLPNGKTVTWTRVSGERTRIMGLKLGTHEPFAVSGLGVNPTDYVSSPDGKSRAWIEWDKTFGVSRLRLRAHHTPTAEIGSDMIVTKSDPAFSPDSKWLLWAQKDPQTGLYGIWSYNLGDKCLQHFLFPSEGDRRDPTVSPDMKFLTYTLVSRGRSRIAQVPFVQRTGPCPPAP